jgi:hypothetical protein
MTDKIESELISRRRAFSLLGLAEAFGLATPPTVLTAPDVEAQQAERALDPEPTLATGGLMFLKGGEPNHDGPSGCTGNVN